jgi:hypothetical protein
MAMTAMITKNNIVFQDVIKDTNSIRFLPDVGMGGAKK